MTVLWYAVAGIAVICVLAFIAEHRQRKRAIGRRRRIAPIVMGPKGERVR